MYFYVAYKMTRYTIRLLLRDTKINSEHRLDSQINLICNRKI